MDSQTGALTQTTSRPERWGPEIYLHLEFRVSWGKKSQPPKNHQITYRSRGSHERSPAFPRQVPAPNTNYLAAIHNFDQRQSRIRELRQKFFDSNPSRHHQMQEYYQGDQHRRAHLQVPVIREPERPTRADARPSHERGSSAPPPIGENPWDVSVPLWQAPHHQHQQQQQQQQQTTAEIRRKPLPPAPSQFRLGEGRQPWSAWSLPVGYDPDTYPRDDDDEGGCAEKEEEEEREGRRPPASIAAADRNSTMFATNPTMVSTFSPEPASPPPVSRTRDLETGRARELGALSAAMMTVDNGFENQWWNQGLRESVVVLAPPPSPSLLPPPPTPPPQSLPHDDRPPRTPADDSPVASGHWNALDGLAPPGVVSPMTEFASFSPAPAPSFLQRTMSTRSEELWLRERGR